MGPPAPVVLGVFALGFLLAIVTFAAAALAIF